MSFNIASCALRRAGAVALLSLSLSAIYAWGNDLHVPSQYSTIQGAINAASPGDTIIIAKGTYKGAGNVNLNTLGKAIRVEGAGYLGTIIDCQRQSRGFVFQNGETSATEIRSLTVQNGRDSQGGGMLVTGANPAILYCSFNDCTADYGGAVAIQAGSPGFIGCQFVHNRALQGGGAVYSYQSSSTFSGNVFDGNTTLGMGGGIAMEGGSLFVVSNNFKDNDAFKLGGAFYSIGGDVAFVNGSFSVNTANTAGGAISLTQGTVSSITNCTFGANLSRNGPGAVSTDGNSSATVANTIMWTDGTKEWDGHVNFRYSCVAGGATGDGNTADDPKLVDAIDHDLHIRIGSACIDKADKSAVVINQDQDGRDRSIGTGPDMGAYEFPIVRPTAVVSADANNVFTVPHDGNPDTDTVLATIHGSAFDWLQGTLSYLWTCDAKVLANTPTLTINLEPGDQVFKLQVRDVTGGISNQDVHVKVLDEANAAPIAICGPDLSLGADAGTAHVTLHGHGYDADGDPLTYSWSPLGVSTQDVDLDLAPGNYTYRLTVRDPYGATGSATLHIHVSDRVGPTVTLNGSTPTYLEVFTTWLEPGATAEDAVDGKDLVVSIYGTVNNSKLGTYPLNYYATDSSGNTGSATRQVIVRDTTPPVITLNGATPMSVQCGSGYVEPGASAIDNYDGSVSVSISGAVPTSKGTYTVTYTASDKSGNIATKTRIVNVTDSTPPVITLNGSNPMTVDCVKGYTEPGATAYDACDGNLPVTITGTVPSVWGTYYVTYTAKDSSGNSASVIRTVYVRSKTPPSANAFNATPTGIKGGQTKSVKLHYGFNSHCAAYTWDTACTVTGPSGSVVTKIDTDDYTIKAVTGCTYTFKLTVTDVDGNTAQYTCTVTGT